MTLLSFFKTSLKNSIIGRGLLMAFCMLFFASPIHAQTSSHKISVRIANATLKDALTRIEAQSSYVFFYNNDTVDENMRISINQTDQTIENVLTELLKSTNYTFRISGRQVYIVDRTETHTHWVRAGARSDNVTSNGTVRSKAGTPIEGASVFVKSLKRLGTVTDSNGRFVLTCPAGSTLVFTHIGYENEEALAVADMNIEMKETIHSFGEVVVTGIVNRDFATYTGSATMISGDELKRVGNQNVFQSLKNLDPALYIMDNLTAGSDPNAMPSMTLRGTTSFPYNNTVDGYELKGNYQNTPNMPLFILDGFETNVERIMDLDMNRIESVTILKDASAKALYGSKAANGVIVIETKRLTGANHSVTYNMSLDIMMPDLTSYDLCNAAEKLEAERLDGIYDGSLLPNFIGYRQTYYDRLKLINDGVDTYWLSKPLRIGVGHKHNVNIELGDNKSLRTIANFTYNNVAGVMKGSDRTTFGGNANISYRTKYITFRNIMSITSQNATDSPWGTFGEYSKMNPYWQAEDPITREILPIAGYRTNGNRAIANPMYDALLGTIYQNSYLEVVNNFYADVDIFESLRASARLGISAKRNDGEEFLPALHSKFLNDSAYSYSDANKVKRGSYRLDNGKGSTYSADLNLTYHDNFDKHSVFMTGGFSVSENKYQTYINRAEGFPTDKGADITFARQYAEGSRPIGTAGLTRSISVLGTGNYTYDNRYFIDLTLRYSASSLFGSDNRWSPGWSVGAGWNINNEKFMESVNAIRVLKIRTSYGITGNQNFNTNEAVGTYLFFSDSDALYNGNTGAYLSKLANPWLRTEQRKDYNVGFDVDINGFSVRFDYYTSDTEHMITSVDTSTSSGFSQVKENLGLIRNSGFELSLNFPVLKSDHGFLALFGSVASNTNKIIRLSDSMRDYNQRQEKAAADKGNSSPVLIYKDGESMNTIWVVPSLGIDPMTGLEIYVKQDGTLTYVYDSLDLKPMGNKDPKYTGVFGFTAEYKGFGVSTTFRFLGGGQYYNEALINRVENVDMDYNVDRRVFLGRWKNPGDNSQFKRLGTFQYEGDPVAHEAKTQATSRFVQDRNDLTMGSFNFYYDFNTEFVKKLAMQRMRMSFYMNDLFTVSTVKTERGLDYPFARTMSFALSVTF